MKALVLMALAAASHRLDSRREAGAEGCPDEQALQRAVAERLGSNPFGSDAPRTVTVRWKGAAGTLSSEVTVSSEDGATVGSRRLTSSSPDCTELAQSTALALALIIDPLSLTRPAGEQAGQAETPPPPPPAEAPPPLPPPLVVIERPPPASPLPTVRPLWAGALVSASVDEVPDVTPALELVVAWKSSWVLLGGAFGFVAPGSKRFDVGSVSATVMGAGPVLCVGSPLVGGCASLRLGALHAWAQGFEPSAQHTATAPSLTLSLGPYVDFAPIELLRVRLYLRGQLQPVAAALVVKALEAWRTPILSAQAGVGLFVVP